jgi:hypothetical protein
LKEGLINLVALGALLEMVAHLREKLVYLFSLKLKINVTRKNLEKLRARDLLVMNGKDASE